MADPPDTTVLVLPIGSTSALPPPLTGQWEAQAINEHMKMCLSTVGVAKGLKGEKLVARVVPWGGAQATQHPEACGMQ